jgi:hypothetical protein
MIVSFAMPLFYDGNGSTACAADVRMCGKESNGSAAAAVKTERRDILGKRGDVIRIARRV